MKRLLFVAIVLISVITTSITTSPASAATFNAGRIIDDTIFTDASTMTVAQIQLFLNSKVKTCDTNGTMSASDFGAPTMTHAQYAASRGWSAPPYTCLKDYTENGVSAAQLIYNLSKEYHINPQVFLVTLQKESSLITDFWPLATQYKTATGYGCPDSGPNNSANCSSTYYGFTNQMTWTAKMYRAVLNQSPTWYSPYVKGANYIQWNPQASCGGMTVPIDNWSTAALYDYTPYQPNAAALNAGYGLGDSCSAYGNRNFYLFFSEWFGSTTVPQYDFESIGQQVFTDDTKTNSIGWNSKAIAGSRVFVQVKVRNMGAKTWNRDNSWPQVQLGTWYTQDHNSQICDTSWIRCSRTATHLEPTVAPGEIATFEFWAKTPTTPGAYGEAFNLVADGLTWFPNKGSYIRFESTDPVYSWQFIGQGFYSDSTRSTPIGWNATITPGQRVYATVIAKNTGNVPWYKNGHWPQVQIGTWLPQDHTSILCDKTWIRCSRATTHTEDIVKPGENATFSFWIQPPVGFQRYGEAFNLVADGLTWLNPTGAYLVADASQAKYTWEFISQANYTDSTKSSYIGWNSTAAANSKVYTVIKAKNTGTVTWRKNNYWPQVQLGTWYQQDRISNSCDPSTWIRCSRAVTHTEDTVAPGEIATFEFWVNTPTISGITNGEAYNLVADGLVWFPSTGLYVRYSAQ